MVLSNFSKERRFLNFYANVPKNKKMSDTFDTCYEVKDANSLMLNIYNLRSACPSLSDSDLLIAYRLEREQDRKLALEIAKVKYGKSDNANNTWPFRPGHQPQNTTTCNSFGFGPPSSSSPSSFP